MLTHEKSILKRQDKGNDEVIIVDEVVSFCSDGSEESYIPKKPKPQVKNNCSTAFLPREPISPDWRKSHQKSRSTS